MSCDFLSLVLFKTETSEGRAKVHQLRLLNERFFSRAAGSHSVSVFRSFLWTLFS